MAHMRFTLVYLRLESHHFLKPFAKTGASGGKEEVLCEVLFLGAVARVTVVGLAGNPPIWVEE